MMKKIIIVGLLSIFCLIGVVQCSQGQLGIIVGDHYSHYVSEPESYSGPTTYTCTWTITNIEENVATLNASYDFTNQTFAGWFNGTDLDGYDSPFIVRDLEAGDLLSLTGKMSSFVINETVSTKYFESTRKVNVVNYTNLYLAYDQRTGVLLESHIKGSYGNRNVTMLQDFKITLWVDSETNALKFIGDYYYLPIIVPTILLVTAILYIKRKRLKYRKMK